MNIQTLECREDLTRLLPELPDRPNIWICAPHPDDFDAIAVTLKRLKDFGATLFLTVASSGASGVEDVFAAAGKGALREAEQLAGCRLFGLDAGMVRFLRMAENDAGEVIESAANLNLLQATFAEAQPDLIALPHGNDTNADHRLIYHLVRTIAPATPLLLNKDPKTIAMREELVTFFDADEAHWKAALLRCHRSQDARNRRTRGYGFDERILSGNRADAARHHRPEMYAEIFEIHPAD